MSMTLASIFLAGGLILLLFAGDLLVRGAASAALKLGVSPLFAGIVIVGFGTSAPEMLVALDAALGGREGLAFGNIVGSNIANILLVLAVPAIFAPIVTKTTGLRRTLFMTALATAVWMLVTYYYELNVFVGIAFLTALVVYVISAYFQARGKPDLAVDVEDEVRPVSGWVTIVALVLLGMVGLPLGAHLTIEGGVAIADELKVPSEIIGLTLLAIGTSLPELAAGIAAAFRRSTDVIIGNVLGSNMFNVLAAGGIVALFGPFDYPQTFHTYDHVVMALALGVTGVYVLSRQKIGWLAGFAFLAVYIAYLMGLMGLWELPWAAT